jgi:hypothetical protein
LASPSDWQAKLRSLFRGDVKGETGLREPLILFAIGLICIALATWAVVQASPH